MTDQKNTEKTSTTLSSNDLAFERTMLAHERTLMAWIRTAVSMISFGFTIYKFFQELSKTPEGQHQLFTPRIVGMIMILFGLLSLVLAQVQHQIAVKKLRQHYAGTQRSVSSVLSILVLMFGLAMFLGALFKQ